MRSTILAMSVQHRVERESRGSEVVKTDLVVDDEMNGAASAIASHGYSLASANGNNIHAPGECGIAVQHRHHLVAGTIAAALLTCAHRAFHHWVDDFQVRRIECQRNVDRAARRRDVRRSRCGI